MIAAKLFVINMVTLLFFVAGCSEEVGINNPCGLETSHAKLSLSIDERIMIPEEALVEIKIKNEKKENCTIPLTKNYKGNILDEGFDVSLPLKAKTVNVTIKLKDKTIFSGKSNITINKKNIVVNLKRN